MYRLFFIFMAWVALSGAHPWRALSRADFALYEIGSMGTLLYVSEACEKELILVQVEAPLKEFPTEKEGLEAWLLAGAKGHTLWALYAIDRSAGAVSEAYSLDRRNWLNTEGATLLGNLFASNGGMRQLFDSDRRKIGPMARDGRADTRKVWTPPFLGSSEGLEKVRVFRSEIKDGPLASGALDLYFLPKAATLPYWIEVDLGGQTRLKAVAKMIGSNLSIPSLSLPRRAPQILSIQKESEKTVIADLFIPSYWKNMEGMIFIDNIPSSVLVEKIATLQGERARVRITLQKESHLCGRGELRLFFEEPFYVSAEAPLDLKIEDGALIALLPHPTQSLQSQVAFERSFSHKEG